jgi:hypothetical protein
MATNNTSSVLVPIASTMPAIQAAPAKVTAAPVPTPAPDTSKLTGLQAFRATAKAVEVTIDGQKLLAQPKEFSTGSYGYFLSGKVVLDGKRCQVGMNVVIIGSKNG